MPIVIKSEDEIATMREAGRIDATVLRILAQNLRPGLIEQELDEIVREGIRPSRCRPHLPRLPWLSSNRMCIRQRRDRPWHP